MKLWNSFDTQTQVSKGTEVLNYTTSFPKASELHQLFCAAFIHHDPAHGILQSNLCSTDQHTPNAATTSQSSSGR